LIVASGSSNKHASPFLWCDDFGLVDPYALDTALRRTNTSCNMYTLLKRFFLQLRCSSQRALYLFPTKALAQDQLRALRQFITGLAADEDGGGFIHDPAVSSRVPALQPSVFTDIRCCTFDGDTPHDVRGTLLSSSHILLSNPDMLHVTMLSKHAQEPYSSLFRNLAFVVVDEVHMYKGCFGSHVALVLRRLRRICALYGMRLISFKSMPLICSTSVFYFIFHFCTCQAATRSSFAVPPPLGTRGSWPRSSWVRYAWCFHRSSSMHCCSTYTHTSEACTLCLRSGAAQVCLFRSWIKMGPPAGRRRSCCGTHR